MKIYVITSPRFEGEIRLEFSEDTGLLCVVDVSETIGVLAHRFLFKNLPLALGQIDEYRQWLKENDSPATVTELVKEVAFEEFWKRYFQGRGSDNSSKKKALMRWSKMSKGEQVRAYNFIARYFSRMQPGVGVKLAETYLNSEIWNN